MRAIQSLAVGKLAQRVLHKEPKVKEIGKEIFPATSVLQVPTVPVVFSPLQIMLCFHDPEALWGANPTRYGLRY